MIRGIVWRSMEGAAAGATCRHRTARVGVFHGRTKHSDHSEGSDLDPHITTRGRQHRRVSLTQRAARISFAQHRCLKYAIGGAPLTCIFGVRSPSTTPQARRPHARPSSPLSCFLQRDRSHNGDIWSCRSSASTRPRSQRVRMPFDAATPR